MDGPALGPSAKPLEACKLKSEVLAALVADTCVGELWFSSGTVEDVSESAEAGGEGRTVAGTGDGGR